VKKKLYIIRKVIQSIGLLDNGKREYKNYLAFAIKEGRKELESFSNFT
jgi:hypothetical protein